MSDQREIHIDYEKLQQFVFGSDTNTCISALNAIEGLFDIREGNAPDAQARVIGIINENIGSFKELILNGNSSVQIMAMDVVNKIVKAAGPNSPDVAFEAIEVALEAKNGYVKSSAAKLLSTYLHIGGNRPELMNTLMAVSMLNMDSHNCGFFRNLATAALRYPDSKEYGIILIGNIISFKNTEGSERQLCLLTVKALLNNGTDLSPIARDLRKFAERREDPFSGYARTLFAEAERNNFNRPCAETAFRKISAGLKPILAPQPQLRRVAVSV